MVLAFGSSGGSISGAGFVDAGPLTLSTVAFAAVGTADAVLLVVCHLRARGAHCRLPTNLADGLSRPLGPLLQLLNGPSTCRGALLTPIEPAAKGRGSALALKVAVAAAAVRRPHTEVPIAYGLYSRNWSIKFIFLTSSAGTISEVLLRFTVSLHNSRTSLDSPLP
jgi:hypothetical protein